MQRKIAITAIALLSLSIATTNAQSKKKKQTADEGFIFTTVVTNPITSVKNQSRSSTCWSFSSLSFLESELLRMGKDTLDLSEMFIVHHTMVDRAERYVRLHGANSFSPGGSFYDALYCWKNYGIVPQEAMPGIQYGDTVHIHNEVDAVASGYVDAIAKSKLKKLTPVWKKGLAAVYDTYLGACPNSFSYQGKEYTPQTFAQQLELNPDDYISITSYTHHPFYTQFAIEIQDNWRNALSYNLPLEEFMTVMDHAINNGYTIAWGSDVSEQGFSRDGIAVMPQADRPDLTGSDMARWTGLKEDEKKKELTAKPLPEITVTQEMRQTAFDNWETTDDHGMQLYGIAKDQHGKEYYMVKNSWGTNSKYKGIWYASKAFVAYKTMNIIVHKDALPKNIAEKLHIN